MITMEQLLEICDPLYDLSDKELEILEIVRSLIHRKIKYVQQTKREIKEMNRRLELARFHCKSSEEYLALSREIKILLSSMQAILDPK